KNIFPNLRSIMNPIIGRKLQSRGLTPSTIAPPGSSGAGRTAMIWRLWLRICWSIYHKNLYRYKLSLAILFSCRRGSYTEGKLAGEKKALKRDPPRRFRLSDIHAEQYAIEKARSLKRAFSLFNKAGSLTI